MDVLNAVLEVFSRLGSWISQSVGELTSMFYVSGSGLTFFGTLAVCGLAFSVVFLLIGLIQRFLHFRG